jgi:hypothetical protein
MRDMRSSPTRAAVAWLRVGVLGPDQRGRARLQCRFPHRVEVRRQSRLGGPPTGEQAGQLVCNAARTLGWPLRSGEEQGSSWMSPKFDAFAAARLPVMEASELTDVEGNRALAQLFACAGSVR